MSKIKTCIFCGNTNLTREHLFADWMAVRFSKEKVMHEISSDRKSVKPWQGEIFSLQPKVACKNCNEGWLSKLENRVKPLIEKMAFEGKTTKLTTLDQESLSCWAQKTIIVHRYVAPGTEMTTFPASLAQQIYRDKRPTPNTTVLIGYRSNNLAPYASVVSRSINKIHALDRSMVGLVTSKLEKGAVFNVGVVLLGHLVMSVHSNTAGISIQIKALGKYESQIHPTDTDYYWPSTKPVEDSVGFLNNFLAR